MTTFLFILTGLKYTIFLCLIVLALSLPLALLLVYFTWKFSTPFTKAIDTFTWVIRGTPLLLQLFFIYYGLGIVGISLSGFISALLAFTINYTAYFIVIFQDAFFKNALDQIEAGLALGMNKKLIFQKILLPQAVQKSLGVLSNETLTLLKDTALISTIGLADILRNAREIVTRDFTITPFVYTFFIYLFFSTIIVFFFNRLKAQQL